MATYTVRIKRQALKQMRRLPTRIRQQAETIIDSLEEEPTPAGARKLRGRANTWRVRFAESYRLIYEVRRSELIVLVLKVGPRGDIYK
ncbi:MAG: type II toxin-antitoxin system RelE/ParE family toxin [Candidatus Tectomicrobia bacterium]|uniref:Type II toxin-antitoxin system RelE/ParE family toxin n=1 Tax=Tectimicrobiota bacterium TaxID=2528274 RepID=A0A932HZ34_UNCTE|nr:type II toxin-antitoxin system RelE/ParE family toxin [Candidatus Tectomicrobia bacterium]